LNPIQAFYQAELQPVRAKIIHRGSGARQQSFLGASSNSL
jgi:hypothetical protein